MTQLVGAICQGGKTVVTVSDRMVGTGDMTLQFEQPRRKAVLLCSNAVVLMAGTIHEPDLIRKAQLGAKGKDDLLIIADTLKDVFQEFREKHLVDEVLRPQTGMKSLDQWRDEQSKLHDSTVLNVSRDIEKYELGLSLLLAGVDTEGHLIRLGDPGTYRSFDYLSYCCIGMGDRHADNVFAWYKYSREVGLNEALYIAFEAKKKAEMAGGVGSSTDILIIDQDSISEVEESTIKKLEHIYNEREAQRECQKFDDSVTKLAIQRRPIGTA